MKVWSMTSKTRQRIVTYLDRRTTTACARSGVQLEVRGGGVRVSRESLNISIVRWSVRRDW